MDLQNNRPGSTYRRTSMEHTSRTNASAEFRKSCSFSPRIKTTCRARNQTNWSNTKRNPPGSLSSIGRHEMVGSSNIPDGFPALTTRTRRTGDVAVCNGAPQILAPKSCFISHMYSPEIPKQSPLLQRHARTGNANSPVMKTVIATGMLYRSYPSPTLYT
jgi:hypothetical protein